MTQRMNQPPLLRHMKSSNSKGTDEKLSVAGSYLSRVSCVFMFFSGNRICGRVLVQ